MANSTTHAIGESAIQRAAHEEDVVVGNEIVRHKFSSRIIHWLVALTFVVALLTGLPVWTPVFGWMAALVGGLSVARWLQAWAGAAFFVFSLIMFVAWVGDMKFEKGDGKWFGPKMIAYFRYQNDDPDVGKYNGGQKIYFFLVTILALLLFASGF